MGSEDIRLLVDAWAVLWTAALLAGYLAHLTPWPQLAVLKAPRVGNTMFVLTAGVVLGLTLGGAREPSAVLAAWAIVVSSVKLLYDNLGQEE